MPTKTDKKLTPHFRESELRCRCRRPDCDAKPMTAAFMERLERLRVDWGKALLPTSGQRCTVQNKFAGGALMSMHLQGRAADFYFPDRNTVEKFAQLAEKHGFNGIGTGKHKCHIDDREHESRWKYYD